MRTDHVCDASHDACAFKGRGCAPLLKAAFRAFNCGIHIILAAVRAPTEEFRSRGVIRVLVTVVYRCMPCTPIVESVMGWQREFVVRAGVHQTGRHCYFFLLCRLIVVWPTFGSHHANEIKALMVSF